jgi:ubiquinone/menaquinone biosynthesis C-methylase UbiE
MLWGTQDLVVMAYSLHHCDDPASMLALARMLLKPGGTLLVIDVVDGTPAFTQAVQYRALDSIVLQANGLARIDHFLDWHRLPAHILGAQVCEVLDRGDVTPSMWIGLA